MKGLNLVSIVLTILPFSAGALEGSHRFVLAFLPANFKPVPSSATKNGSLNLAGQLKNLKDYFFISD